MENYRHAYICVDTTKHPEWGVIEGTETLTYMRQIKASIFNDLCAKAGVNFTPKQKKERKLFACSVCLRYIQYKKLEPGIEKTLTSSDPQISSRIGIVYE